MSEQLKGTFETVWHDWWRRFPAPSQRPTTGALRRINLSEMLPDTAGLSERAVKTLLKAVSENLSELLSGTASVWSPASGIIDIHYGKLGNSAADLKHSVVVSTLERCAKDALPAPAASASSGRTSETPRRVDWETFQALCAKTKVRPDQIHVLDITEVLFGAPQPNQTLTQRVWNKVDEILDAALANGGYCTRYSGNRVLMFFPGFAKSLGELKQRAIADEIREALGKSTPQPEAAEAPDADQDGLPRTRAAQSKPVQRALTKEEKAEEAERAHLDQAIAAIANDRSASLLTEDEWAMPEGFDARVVPMWWAKNRTVGGGVLEPLNKTDGEWDRFFPTSSLLPEPLGLPMLARAMDAIKERIDRKKPSLVVVPVYWSYLDRKRFRERYLEFCTRLSEPARRLLVFELAGIPEDLVNTRIEERMRQLRPFCRAVTCRVRLLRRDFRQFRGLQLHALGVDLGELPAYERGIIGSLDSFMDAVEPLKLKTYCHGLNTKSLLIAAQAAGVDYIAGSVIPESEEVPIGIRDFQVADLYSDGIEKN